MPRFAQLLAVLVLLFNTGVASAATGLNQTWDIEFRHTNGVRSVNWCKTIYLATGEDRYVCGQQPGQTWISLGGGYRPSGALNQVLSFEFYSDGYFANADSHFAFGLRGHWPQGASNSNPPTGRGMLIGKTNEHPTQQGCKPGPAAQIELFRADYPIFKNSCSFGLLDHHLYRVTVQASSDNTVSYSIRDVAGRVVYHSPAQYDALATNGLEGWIGEVGFDRGNWSVLLSNVRLEWW